MISTRRNEDRLRAALHVNLGSKSEPGSTKAAVEGETARSRDRGPALADCPCSSTPSPLHPPLPPLYPQAEPRRFSRGPDATMRRLDGRDVTLNGYT